MIKKRVLKKALAMACVVVSTVLFVPGTESFSLAANTDKSSTYKSIVYGEGETAVNTVSETGRKIRSTGILADSSDYVRSKIYIDTDDFRKIAYNINEFNRQVSSTDKANNRSFNNAIAGKNMAKSLYKKIGYGTSTAVSTDKVDGFSKASETKALSEKVLNSIR